LRKRGDERADQQQGLRHSCAIEEIGLFYEFAAAA
jgi:hypothetical protein